MGVYVKFKFKAPRLVEYLKEIGIDISVKDDRFTELSEITLPSGAKACIFDEDAWGETLYGPQEMGLPRELCGINSGGSLVAWLIQHLTNVGDEGFCDEDFDVEDYCDKVFVDEELYDEEYDDEENEKSMAFCREAKEIIENKFPGKDIWKKIAELDDLIDEAEVLYLNYWGGEEFDYTYAEMKDQEALYWDGDGSEDAYEGWYWNNLIKFKKLVKDNIPAQVFERNKSNWIEKK